MSSGTSSGPPPWLVRTRSGSSSAGVLRILLRLFHLGFDPALGSSSSNRMSFARPRLAAGCIRSRLRISAPDGSL